METYEEDLEKRKRRAHECAIKSLKRGAIGLIENAEKIIGGYDHQTGKVEVTIIIDPYCVVPTISVRQEFLP